MTDVYVESNGIVRPNYLSLKMGKRIREHRKPNAVPGLAFMPNLDKGRQEVELGPEATAACEGFYSQCAEDWKVFGDLNDSLYLAIVSKDDDRVEEAATAIRDAITPVVAFDIE